MNPPSPLLLAALCTLLAGACASPPRTGDFVVPEGPVEWPTGRYVASGRIEARSTASAASGLGAAEHVQVELYVSPEGDLYPRSGVGACQETERRRPAARAFRCGSLGLSFVTDGEVIRGWATLPMTVTVRSNSLRCVQWQMDSKGTRWCVRREADTTTRTVLGTGELAVTAVR